MLIKARNRNLSRTAVYAKIYEAVASFRVFPLKFSPFSSAQLALSGSSSNFIKPFVTADSLVSYTFISASSKFCFGHATVFRTKKPKLISPKYGPDLLYKILLGVIYKLKTKRTPCLSITSFRASVFLSQHQQTTAGFLKFTRNSFNKICLADVSFVEIGAATV